VNTPDDIARMIDIGVDGIISDHPDLLRKIAGDKGIALPAGHPVKP
jgi:glycerophosphoryl diester phosphodiesterase